jgi:predicted nucleic acid-binding protein
MRESECFVDTSVLLYLLSADDLKASRVEELLGQAAVISVQVLNEFAAVASRKFAMPYADISRILATVRAVCRTEPLTGEDHDRAIAIAGRYRFSFFDSLIVASAMRAGCRTLYSEDLQHRQLVGNSLRIVNPFIRPHGRQ